MVRTTEIDLEMADTTPLGGKLRFIRTIDGRRVKRTRMWVDTGAERKPLKSFKPLHPEIDIVYFQKLAPRLGSYQVSLRPWQPETNP